MSTEIAVNGKSLLHSGDLLIMLHACSKVGIKAFRPCNSIMRNLASKQNANGTTGKNRLYVRNPKSNTNKKTEATVPVERVWVKKTVVDEDSTDISDGINRQSGKSYTAKAKAKKMKPNAGLAASASTVLNDIAVAMEEQRVSDVLDLYALAKKAKVKLTIKEYSAVLWACSATTTVPGSEEFSDSSENGGYGSSFYSKVKTGNSNPVYTRAGSSAHSNYINASSPTEYLHAQSHSSVNNGRALQAFDIYTLLKNESHIPVEVFLMVMKVCAMFGSASTANMILYDYSVVMKYEVTSEILGHYIIAIAKYLRRSGNTPAATGNHTFQSLFSHNNCNLDRTVERDLYNTYIEYVRLLLEEQPPVEIDTGGEGQSDVEAPMIQRGSPEVFEQLTRSFSSLGRQEIVIESLKHTVEVGGFEPTVEFCNELLENALLEADVKTMFVLSNWYIHNFTDYKDMPYGCVIKMLHIACGGGNGALAVNCIQLLRQYGYEVTPANYAAWVHACILTQDMPGVVEALIEAEASGIDLAKHDITNGGEVDFFYLQDQISIHLSLSLRNIDELYYALVDLIRQNHTVPAMCVNAIISASGMNSHLDRAFQTMSEYTELFNLKPNVHTYNALLCAVSRSPDKCFMKTMLLILERMDSEGILPNSISYALLFDAMVELDQYHSVEDILQYIDEFKLKPTQKSLRRLAIGLAGHPQYHSKLDLILPYLDASYEYASTQKVCPGTSIHTASNASDKHATDAGNMTVKDATADSLDKFSHLPSFFAKRLRYQIHQREQSHTDHESDGNSMSC